MNLKIVHFSKTPLAGAPIRLVRTLQNHTDFSVRLVDLRKYADDEGFGYDVIFSENPELVLALAEDADIIHLHNYLDLRSEEFSPIDFHRLKRLGKRFIRQFHSHPGLVAQIMGRPVRDVLEDELPSLVVGQFQERFYPKAQVVPNVLPQNDQSYLPSTKSPGCDVFFCPTNGIGTWEDRWNTKGSRETHALLQHVTRKRDYSYKYISQKPLAEVLEIKRQARIVVDELVTGSCHLSGFEGLSMGKVVFSYLDPRTEYVLRQLTGAEVLPFVNVRLEDAVLPMEYFLSHRDETTELGHSSRMWFLKYYKDATLVQHYVKAYDALLEDPRAVVRQANLRLDDPIQAMSAFVLPELIHETRKQRRFLCSQKVATLLEGLLRLVALGAGQVRAIMRKIVR